MNVYMTELIYNCSKINIKRSIQLYFYFKQHYHHREQEFNQAITALIAQFIERFDRQNFNLSYLFILTHGYFTDYTDVINTHSISKDEHDFIINQLPKNLQALSHSITKNFRAYPAYDIDNDKTLKIENGIFRQQRIYSNKKAGIFTFGPYIYLPASIFKVCIEVEIVAFTSYDPIIIKITADGGKTLIKETAIYSPKCRVSLWEIEDIILEKQANNVEVVIILPDNVEIILDKISFIVHKLLLSYH